MSKRRNSEGKRSETQQLKQRFGRQSGVPSIVVPLKIDQQKSTQYWRTRSQ